MKNSVRSFMTKLSCFGECVSWNHKCHLILGNCCFLYTTQSNSFWVFSIDSPEGSSQVIKFLYFWQHFINSERLLKTAAHWRQLIYKIWHPDRVILRRTFNIGFHICSPYVAINTARLNIAPYQRKFNRNTIFCLGRAPFHGCVVVRLANGSRTFKDSSIRSQSFWSCRVCSLW